MVAGLDYAPDFAAPGGGGGGGGDMVEILASPGAGAWSPIQRPHAQALGNYTYIGHINGSGDVQVTIWDHSTDAFVATRTVNTTLSADVHNNPAVLIEANTHKLWIAYSEHNGGTMYLRRSTTSLDTDPDLGDGFAAEQSLHAQLGGWADYTYPTLLQLTSETNDPVYLLYRKHHTNGRLMFSKSNGTDGATWAAEKMIYYTAGSFDPYWRIGTNGTDRIDFFVADGVSATTNLYHFYYDGTWHMSDGTTLTGKVVTGAGGADAISKADVTLVLNNAAGVIDRAYGACWDGSAPAGLAWQVNGASRRAVSVRWRTGAWQIDTVVDDVGGILASNAYISGAQMHPTNPDLVYVAKLVSSVWQMFRYTSADDGVTWTPTQLSTGGGDNFAPVLIVDNNAALEGVWLYGSFVSNTSWTVGFRGMPEA